MSNTHVHKYFRLKRESLHNVAFLFHSQTEHHNWQSILICTLSQRSWALVLPQQPSRVMGAKPGRHGTPLLLNVVISPIRKTSLKDSIGLPSLLHPFFGGSAVSFSCMVLITEALQKPTDVIQISVKKQVISREHCQNVASTLFCSQVSQILD